MRYREPAWCVSRGKLPRVVGVNKRADPRPLALCYAGVCSVGTLLAGREQPACRARVVGPVAGAAIQRGAAASPKTTGGAGNVTGSGWQHTLGDCGHNSRRGPSGPRLVLQVRQNLRFPQLFAQFRPFEDLRAKISLYPGEYFKPRIGDRQAF